MRRAISLIFILLGCFSASIALVAIWMDQIGDTDRYVEMVAPLAANPAVQDTVTDQVTAAIAESLRPLDASVSDHTVRVAVDAVVTGDGFPAIWRRVNRGTHRELSAIMSDRGGVPAVRDGTVGLDLTPVYEPARRGLMESGVPIAARLPDLRPTIELFSRSDLAGIRSGYAWMVRLKWVLPILSPVLLVAGVLVARDRRSALIGAGLGLAGGMVVLAAILAVIRNTFLPDLAGDGSQTDAVLVIFDTLTRFLRIGLRVIFTLGLLLAVAAFVAGLPHQSRAPANDVPAGR